MKNKVKNLFDQKNMKIIIPVIVLLVLFIVLFVYFRVYQYNNYRNKTISSFYQYFGDLKFEYDATVSYDRNDVIKVFAPNDIKVNYESIPIYSSSEDDVVILPSDMMILLPLKKELQYKIPSFSYLKKVGSIQYIVFDKYNNNIDHYVLYDGENLYFFSDSVTFTINGETVTLSPFSYIIDSLNEFSYYDYETDTYNTYEYSNEVVVTNDYYTINVTNDYVNYFGERLLLSNNFDFLNYLN